jgi:MFS family permease
VTVAEVQAAPARGPIVGILARRVPSLLGELEFRRFWLGQTISVFGDQVTLLALPIIAVLVLHADAGQMGLLTAAGLLPHLFLSLPAGVWLDRVRRKRRLMILADVGRAIAIASVPVAFLMGGLKLEQLFVVTFIVGCFTVVFDISWNTLFVSVTRREQYVSANALLSGSRSVAQVGGPSIAGLLIQLLGAPLTILADAASFIGSASFLSRIEAPERDVEESPGSVRAQLASGLSFILGDGIVRPALLSVATLNLFNFAFQALFILYVTTRLGVDPGTLGLALGAGAIGGVLGAIIAPAVGRRLGLGPAYVLGLVLFPASLVVIPLVSGPFELILGGLFLAEFGAGLGVMILDINSGAMLLARTPDRMRGRVNGAFRFINYGIRPIGALLGGVLGTVLGVREALLSATLASFLGLLFLWRSPLLGLRDLPEAGD